MKNFFYVFSYAIIFVALLTITNYAQCPTIGDALNNGWTTPYEGDPHYPEQDNRDEFGAVDPSPFIIKVNDYVSTKKMILLR